MHELPVVTDVVKVVNEAARERSCGRVTSITIVVGELSSVIDESVQMYFELLAEGTPCEGAVLRFIHVPALLKCSSCGEQFEHKDSFSCPKCGGDGMLVKGTGRELYVKSFETE